MMISPDMLLRPRPDMKRMESMPAMQRRYSEDIVHEPQQVMRKDSGIQRRHSEDFAFDALAIDTSAPTRHLTPDKVTCDVITFFLSVSELNLQGSTSATDQLIRGALSFFGGKKAAPAAPAKTQIPESLIHIDLQSRLRETIPFQTEKMRCANPCYSLGISIPIVPEEIGVQVLCFNVVLTEEGNGKTVAYAELPVKELVRKYMHGTSVINVTLKSLVGPLRKKPAVLSLKMARVVAQTHALFESEDKMMRTYAFYNGEYSTPVVATEEAEAVESHATVPARFLSEMVAEMQASLDLWHLRYETKTPREAEPPSSLFHSHDVTMDRLWQDLHPPMDLLYASGFLEGHLTTLEKHVAETREMMTLAELLEENSIMFKSSAAKDKRDTMAMATNLCLSTFRLYKSTETTPLQRMRSLSMDLNDSSDFHKHDDTVHHPRRGRNLQDELRQRKEAKKDRSISMDLTNQHHHAPAPTPRSAAAAAPLVVDETLPLLTCAAPSADALGDASHHGLRELEDELVQLATQLRHAMQMELPDTAASSTTGSSSLSSRKSELSLDDNQEENRSSSNGSTASATDNNDMESILTRSARKLNFSALEAAAKKVSKARSDSFDWVKSRVRSDSFEWSKKDSMMMSSSGMSMTGGGGTGADSPGHTQALWTKWEQTKAEYVFRKCICVSQSVTVLVAAFLAKLETILDAPLELEQLARIGFLMGWECLLFAQGKEQRMLSDTYVAAKALEKFVIQLVPLEGSTPRVAFPDSSLIQLGVPPSVFEALPASLRDRPVHIHCVVFTQGLHEMQNIANLVNASGFQLQGTINRESFQCLQRYHRAFLDMQKEMDVNMRLRLNMETLLEPLMPLVGRNAKYNKALASTNTLMLLEAADIVRKLNGMRVTCCPTGADHTAMSVTLEQARVLYSKRSGNGSAHNEDVDVIKPIANLMREYGVRIAISMKNTGRFEYGFNSIQRKLLPELYRPPVATIQEMTSPFF
ncbi:Aste57867_15565 [Aphanomyces stellatus]|uniref:Aste57867_15565 protein n=1 Tax=Aphanomyces stellatus TaxID=120398 RepID=A0A485L5A8_9STRA|nr:hypothetical protein As57867_015509 [Aphanomyces stellatus]VFT92367.1 Aste57867_15565 [Aphanomyces stellatus]